MKNDIVPVIIRSPWGGEVSAQRGVAYALQPDSFQHIIISDPFWKTDVERAYKAASGDIVLRRQQGAACIQLARRFIRETCRVLDDHNLKPVIINMGGRDSSAFLALAAKYDHPQSLLMNILYPKQAKSYFDLLALTPAEKTQKTNTPTINVGSVPNMICPRGMREERDLWNPTLRRDGQETLAILIGGYTGTPATYDVRPFTINHAWDLIRHVDKTVQETGCNIVLTTSRRTPKDVADLLYHELGPQCLHSYFGEEGTPNPYKGYLASAGAILVTAESMSMISDSVDAGRRVYTFYPSGVLTDEHERFHQAMVDGNHVTPLPARIEFGPGRPVHASKQIADHIKGMIEHGAVPKGNRTEIISGGWAL